MDTIVRRKLKEARRRLTGERFFAHAAWALVFGFSALGLLRALVLISPSLRSKTAGIEVWILAVPLLIAAITAIAHWWNDRRVAREVDVRAATRDRFLTVLDLDPKDSPRFAHAVRDEVTRFASGLSLSEALRLRLPFRRYLWVLVPLLGLAGIEGLRHWQVSRGAPERAEARGLIAAVREAATRHPEDKDLQEEAQKLESAEEELSRSAEPLRDALRALADLEQTLAAQAQLSPAETAALAEALAAGHPQLASDLRSGNQEAAAKSLSQLDPEAVANALEEAARHVENSRLREMSRRDSEKNQRRLVTMVKSSGSGTSERSQFLSRVQDIKSGAAASDDPSPSDSESGDGDNPKGQEKSGAGDGDNAPPGGAPGSEKDTGRGPQLAGEAEPNRDSSGPDDFVPGIPNDGATLVEIFRASGSDDPEAQQTYRSAYDTARPAALDAVAREEIPPGSRILVRRYFEAIRPKE